MSIWLSVLYSYTGGCRCVTIVCLVAMTAVMEALEKAIENHRTGHFVPPAEVHERVKKLYTWQNVARRTEAVYDTIAHEPYIDLSDRLQR